MGNDYALVVSNLVISYLKFVAALCCRLCQLTLLHSERPKHTVLAKTYSFGHSECNKVNLCSEGVHGLLRLSPNLLFPKFCGGLVTPKKLNIEVHICLNKTDIGTLYITEKQNLNCL